MDLEDHYRKLENMYHSAPCNAYYNPHLTVEDGKAVVLIPVKSNLFHAAGAVHGSVYFKAMDDAAFFSVSSNVTDVFVLTVDFKISFRRPISSGTMRAEGKVVARDNDKFTAETKVFDDTNNLIGQGSGIFLKSRIPLSEELGYQ